MTLGYSARPDGRITLEQFIAMIPDDQRSRIEDDLNQLMTAGYGELCFRVDRGKPAGHKMTLDRRWKSFQAG